MKEGLVGFFHIILSNIVLKFSQTLIKANGSMYFHKIDRYLNNKQYFLFSGGGDYCISK